MLLVANMITIPRSITAIIRLIFKAFSLAQSDHIKRLLIYFELKMTRF